MHRSYLLFLSGLLLLISLFLSAFYHLDPIPTETTLPTPSETPSPENTLSPPPTVPPGITATPTTTLTIIPPNQTTTPTPTNLTIEPSITFTPTFTPEINLGSRLETTSKRGVYHKWGLIYWSDNAVACYIYLDSDATKPTSTDILAQCGETIYWLWYNTSACQQKYSSNCDGVYLFDYGLDYTVITTTEYRPILINADVTCISLDGINKSICDGQPRIHFRAVDTMSGAWVKSIEIHTSDNLSESNSEGILQSWLNFGGSSDDLICSGDYCNMVVPNTGTGSIFVEYWANSTIGDASTRHFLTIQSNPEPQPSKSWQISLVGDQFSDSPLANTTALSMDWLSLPPSTLPDFLTTPNNPQELTSKKDYYYLAGMIIRNGLVKVKDCQGAGLEANGITANECGLLKAKPYMKEWQNIFDLGIYQTASRYRLPPRLIKSIFSRESQFFPDYSRTEFGLGQITDNGADTLLMYDTDLYKYYCSKALNYATCNMGYTSLSNECQAMLRGLVLNDADSSCQTCVNNIDINKANASIDIFARLLIANGRQIGRIIERDLNKKPGQVSSYVDLWKFTLLAYNAGAGCFEQALLKSPLNQSIIWDDFKTRISTGCMSGVNYAESIAVTY